MLISVKLTYANGGKVWFSDVMLPYICNNFDDFVADFREVIEGLIDLPQHLYSQPIKSQKSPTIFGLRLLLKVCI